jgi:hypothetical protein
MRPLVSLFALAAILTGCGGGDSNPASGSGPTIDPGASTFARLQSSVLTPSCAVSGCHVSASASASGNLVLSPDVAYDNLVGIKPANLAAQRDGFRRVTPFRPDSSLLFQKTVLALSAAHTDYGNIMPVGTQALTQGQVDFIRKWIEAGAPRTGTVVDESVLANKTAQTKSAFIPLAPPAAGQGVQIHVDSFGVHSNFERELFVYRPLNNAAPIYVNRIQTLMRDLSHHFVLYSVDPNMAKGFPCTPSQNTVRDIRNADGSMNFINMIPMACHVFVGGSMTQASDYVFPAGVALELPASMAIDMNVHYVNRTAGEIPGEAFANLYTIPAAQVTHAASTLNMANTSFTLPPKTVTTVEKTFNVSQTTTIFMLTSHMHMLGTRFQIKISGGSRDGELVYENTDWEHPQTISFPTPIVLQKGQGLKSVITWNNTTGQTVSFGLSSTDEMGIIFGYYY